MEPLLFCAQYLLHRSQFEIRQGQQPENALFIIEKGCFSCRFSDAPMETARAGDFVFFPREKCFTREIIDPIDFHLIYFKRNAEDPLSARLPYGVTAFDGVERQRSNLQILRALLNRTDAFAVRMKQHVLNDIYYQYLTEAEMSPPLCGETRTPDAVLRTADYLKAHVSETVSLNALAEMACVSPSTLNRCFKTSKGLSPIAYMVKLRMRAAKRFLILSDAAIGEIAEQCGYSNVYYFSRAFKKECGCTPSEYRKNAPRV